MTPQMGSIQSQEAEERLMGLGEDEEGREEDSNETIAAEHDACTTAAERYSSVFRIILDTGRGLGRGACNSGDHTQAS